MKVIVVIPAGVAIWLIRVQENRSLLLILAALRCRTGSLWAQSHQVTLTALNFLMDGLFVEDLLCVLEP